MASLQRAQEVQDILLLRWAERIEVVDDPISFGVAVVEPMVITVLIMATGASAAGVGLDRLQ